jgi:hypothetical protein
MKIQLTYNHIYNNVEYVHAVVVLHNGKHIVIITPPIKRFHTIENLVTSFNHNSPLQATDRDVADYIKSEKIKFKIENDFGYLIDGDLFVCKKEGLYKYFPAPASGARNPGTRDALSGVRSLSKLEQYKYNKKVAERLNFYSYYLSVATGNGFEYVVDEKNKYDLDTMLINNKTFIKDKKLIVPSRKTGERLAKRLKNLTVNASHFTNKTLVDSEYTEQGDSLVFSNINQLKNHNENVSPDTKQDFRDKYVFSKQPYFVKVDGEIFILQNLKKDTKDNAVATAATWKKDKINLGFNSDSAATSDASIHIFTITDGEINSSKNIESGDVEILEIEENKYAVLLKFNMLHSSILDKFEYDDGTSDDGATDDDEDEDSDESY